MKKQTINEAIDYLIENNPTIDVEVMEFLRSSAIEKSSVEVFDANGLCEPLQDKYGTIMLSDDVETTCTLCKYTNEPLYSSICTHCGQINPLGAYYKKY